MELIKAGQEYAEKLTKYFHDDQPMEQIEALKEINQEFFEKLTSYIRYKDGDSVN